MRKEESRIGIDELEIKEDSVNFIKRIESITFGWELTSGCIRERTIEVVSLLAIELHRQDS